MERNNNPGCFWILIAVLLLLAILMSCTSQKYNKSVNATIIGWDNIEELSADVVFVSQHGDTLYMPYEWYAGRRPNMEIGQNVIIKWDSTRKCKNGFLRHVKVEFVQ